MLGSRAAVALWGEGKIIIFAKTLTIMPDTPPERIYKHQVPAEVFVEAFTTLDWAEEQTKRFNKVGIERLKGKELRKREFGLSNEHYRDDEEFILVVDIEITRDITIKFNNSILPHLCIYNSRFKNVSLNQCLWGEVDSKTKKLSYGTNFSIKDCIVGVFEINHSKVGSFYIENSAIGDFNISTSTTGGFKIIDKCTTKDFTIFNSIVGIFHVVNSTMGGFSTWNKSYLENLHISNCIAGIFNISRESTMGYFTIENSTTEHSIIENSITGDLSINNSNMKGLTVTNSITENINISNNSTTGSLSISDSTIELMRITNSSTGECGILKSVISEFRIKNSSSPLCEIWDVSGSFYFSKANIGQCRLINCLIPELTIQNECGIELYVSDGQINHLNFEQLTLGKGSVVSLSKTRLYTCNMNEFTMLGNLYLRGIKRSESVFEWPNITETLQQKFPSENGKKDKTKFQQANEILNKQHRKYFEDATQLIGKFSQATFRISQSSLGKTEFTDCDLAGFNFEYNNSKITEVFISGGTVPDDVTVYGEINPVKILEQKKSFFDQLKKVFEGQGDIVRGTKYHARASEIQMQIIEKAKGKWNTEWLVYKLNEVSNRHGESWGQAVKFISCVSIPSYSLYWLFTFQISIDGVWSWELFFDSIGYYFTFLLPTHKIDFIPNAHQNLGTMAFDFIGRIVIGYGIYQLISAFRKHGKRG